MIFMEKVAETEATEKDKSTAKEVRLVCFVCTGNTCRSPMAEAVFNHLSRMPALCAALGTLAGGKAVSRGLFATGEPIAAHAVTALENADIPSLPDNPYREHISQSIDDETAKAADLIVGMTDAHVFALLSRYPAYASKITGMPASIDDPYGGDLDAYEHCLTEIRCGIDMLFFGGDGA